MNYLSALGYSFTVVCLSACCSQSVQPIDVNSISAVQSAIKSQVGVYIAAAKAYASPDDPLSKDGPTVLINDVPTVLKKDDFQCGSGSIDFRLSAVKVELTTTVDATAGATLGLSIPLTGITLGPSVGLTKEALNQQTLDYNLWPLGNADQNSDLFANIPTVGDIKNAPIARALLELRDALILSATTNDYSTNPVKMRAVQPCFTDYNPATPRSDAGNLFKIALTITNDTKGSIAIGVAPLTFTPSGENKSSTGNTLSVSFVQRDLTCIQTLRDEVTSECKFPKDDSTLCAVATKAIKLPTASQKKRAQRETELTTAVSKVCSPAPPAVPADCTTAKKLQKIATECSQQGGLGVELY